MTAYKLDALCERNLCCREEFSVWHENLNFQVQNDMADKLPQDYFDNQYLKV